jgi:hypothetical protein
MRHTKNSHNSTLYHTLSHYFKYHTLHSGAYMRDHPHTPISKSHFFASTDQLYIYVYTIVSLELAQRLNPCPLYTPLHIHIYVYMTLHPAAGPLANPLYTVKYSMDHKLQSLILAITLVIIWYAIHI